MHPILFKIGTAEIYTYGFFIAMGFLVGFRLAKREAERIYGSSEKITDLCFYIVLASLAGARIFYVFTELEVYIKSPLEVFKLWNGGLVFYGGFIAAFIAAFIYIKKNNMSFLKTIDIIAPSIAVGHFLGRIGCFFAGCCYGKSCELPWNVTFTNPNTLAPYGVSVHPTQLYSAVLNLVILIILISFRRVKKFDGQLFCIYILLYGIGRTIIETFRGDIRGGELFGIVSISQFIGSITALLAVIMILYLSKKYKVRQ